MSKSVIGARLIHRLSTVSGVTPTIPTNDDHTTGWLATDIYKSELFININDDRAWTRTNSGITEFVMTDRLTNKVPVSRMANEINGNFYISGGLSVGSLSGIGQGLRPIFASEDGLLITGAGVSGSGTVTQILAGLGLVTNPSMGITTSGTIQMGTPNDITPLSTNSFPSNSGHTHKFVPAGNNTEIQFNSGNSISSSTNLKYDGTDLYVMNMTNSGTSYVLCYNTSNGRITYNMGSVVAGSSTQIQFNSGGSMSASPNLKYDGTDLYVMNMTQTGTSYIVFYNNITGRFSYNLSTAGTVSSVIVGNGLSGGTITTTGIISLGTPFNITETSDGSIFSDGHDHKIQISSGINGSLLYKTISSGLTCSTNLIFDGNNLYIPSMEQLSDTYCVYYNNITGKLTYNTYTNGTITNILAGSGMSFTEITTSGSINLGTPSTVNAYSDNSVYGSTHTHKFELNGNNGEIQFNSGNTLFSSSNLIYDGIDMYISGMTSNITNDVIYYDSITGRLTYGVKPSGGTTPGGSDTYVQFNDGGTTFGGHSGLTYSKITGNLTSSGLIKGSNIETNPTSLSVKIGIEAGKSEDQSASRRNIYIGFQSGQLATNGATDCVSIGYQSLFNNTTGDYNISIGTYASFTNGTGHSNVVLGYNAAFNNTSGSYSVYIGRASGEGVSTGSHNSCVGYGTGQYLGASTGNVLFGSYAGAYLNNTTGAANYNCFIGYQCASSSNINGDYNIGIGFSAFSLLTTGSYNIGIGNNCLTSVTTGTNNTSIGLYSGMGGNVSNSIYLGAHAGRYEGDSNKLFIDSLDRVDESTARTSSIIYGVISGVSSNQELYFNATSYTKRLVKTYQLLTSSASITMNVRNGQNARVTLGISATLTLSNLIDGDEGNIIITQDGTGGKTLTISPTPKVINGGGGVITLTGTANSTDMLSYTYSNSVLYITYGKNYS